MTKLGLISYLIVYCGIGMIDYIKSVIDYEQKQVLTMFWVIIVVVRALVLN